MINKHEIISFLPLLFLVFYAYEAVGSTAMTWQKIFHNTPTSPAPDPDPTATDSPSVELLGIDYVGCNGCDPDNGDMSCEEKLPILCLKQDGTPNPGVPIIHYDDVAMPDEYYNGWARGHISLTLPVRGSELQGVADGNDICEFQFGPGYRMAEFHDGTILSGGKGGWFFYAFGNIDDSSHFWVQINDKSANCWGAGVGETSNRTDSEIRNLLLDAGEPPQPVCSHDTYSMTTGVFHAPCVDVSVFGLPLTFDVTMQAISGIEPLTLEVVEAH